MRMEVYTMMLRAAVDSLCDHTGWSWSRDAKGSGKIWVEAFATVRETSDGLVRVWGVEGTEEIVPIDQMGEVLKRIELRLS